MKALDIPGLRLVLPVIFGILLCGCAPVLYRYKHVVLAESETIRILERSTQSNDSQGKPLSGRKIGLPLRSVLTRNGYTVTFFMPLDSAPIVSMEVDDQNHQGLALKGAHLLRLDGKSGTSLKGYRYFFLMKDAAGAPIEFDVVTEQGVVLGHEKINYDVVSRGYTWDIDAV